MRRALLIGIDDYASAPLSGCVNDATRIAELLRRHEDGSPNYDCRLITGPPEQLTRAALRQHITELFATPADEAFFFFAGHGTENNLGGYLVTPDAATYDAGVPMLDVLTLANKAQIREVVIALDCCNSGALGALPPIANDAANVVEGRTVLTASRATESAQEADGAGVFSALLAAALEGGAADILGNVTAGSAYAYLEESLGPWAQRPLMKAYLSRLSLLRKCRPAIDPAVLRQLPAWFPKSDQVFQLDPSYEPTAEPRDETHEKVFAHLQKLRAAKLVEPVGEDHMYYAAMNSKGCQLTPLGRHYWRLANEGRL